MSIWTDGLPAWWAMVVAVAALLVGVWLGELHGRTVGYRQAGEDRAADVAVARVRAWRAGREERTAAFLDPDVPVMYGRRRPRAADEDPHLIDKILAPEVAHEALVRYDTSYDHPGWEADDQAHEAWLAHTEQALDLANDDPTVSAWTQQMAESMDAFLAGLLAEHPVPYQDEQ